MTSSRSATLLALAERCEKADGPDRELDFAIFREVSGHTFYEDGWFSFSGREDEGRAHISVYAPRYSESIDAAHPTTGEAMTFRIDELDDIQVIG